MTSVIRPIISGKRETIGPIPVLDGAYFLTCTRAIVLTRFNLHFHLLCCPSRLARADRAVNYRFISYAPPWRGDAQIITESALLGLGVPSGALSTMILPAVLTV